MITKEQFEQMKFESHGFIEPEYEKVSYRLPAGATLNARPTDELRRMICSTVHEVKEQTKKTMTVLIIEDCDIPMATYKQYVSGSGRHPTRSFISKLCVGLKLPIEKANELLRAHSGELNLTNDVDKITYYALEGKDSIDDYEAELLEKCGINLCSTDLKK